MKRCIYSSDDSSSRDYFAVRRSVIKAVLAGLNADSAVSSATYDPDISAVYVETVSGYSFYVEVHVDE